MTGHKGSVVHLHQRDRQEALARLNRITGLRFSQWPESLLEHVEPVSEPGLQSGEPEPEPENAPARVAPV